MPSKVILILAILFSFLWPFFDIYIHGHFDDARYEAKVRELIERQDYFHMQLYWENLVHYLVFTRMKMPL